MRGCSQRAAARQQKVLLTGRTRRACHGNSRRKNESLFRTSPERPNFGQEPCHGNKRGRSWLVDKDFSAARGRGHQCRAGLSQLQALDLADTWVIGAGTEMLFLA